MTECECLCLSLSDNNGLDDIHKSAEYPHGSWQDILVNGGSGHPIGSKAVVSFNGSTVDAVVADVSGPNDIGKISIAAAQALGIPSSPSKPGRMARAGIQVEAELEPSSNPTRDGFHRIELN